jgi:hypothetical protein
MEENFILLGEIAKRLSYKPGYTFSIRRIDDEKALISLRCPSLPHSVEEGEEVGLTINNTVKLSAIVTPSDALHAFTNLVASLELHEAAEWFKIDDRQVFLAHGWGDDFGGFKWEDFMNLNGKYLSALKSFMEQDSM